MSAIFIDSFDHYIDILDKWDTNAGAFGVLCIQEAGRFTPGALLVQGQFTGGRSATKNLPDTTDIYIGYAWNNFNASNFVSKQFILGDVTASILLDSQTGVAEIQYDGHTVTSASGVLTASAWQFIEIHIFQHPTLGIIELRHNGVSILSATNIDTDGGAFTAFTVSTGFASEQYYMDDLYILNGEGTTNNGFLGDTRITALRPTANGLDNNFTPSGAGDNFSAVNETTQDGDTTFVEAGQIGAQEKYTQTTFSDLGISPGTIFIAQVVNATKKTDAGQLKYLDQMIIGGIEFDNGEPDVIATSGVYKMSRFIRDTDPSDDATWTEAKIDALGSGIEITFREV